MITSSSRLLDLREEIRQAGNWIEQAKPGSAAWVNALCTFWCRKPDIATAARERGISAAPFMEWLKRMDQWQRDYDKAGKAPSRNPLDGWDAAWAMLEDLWAAAIVDLDTAPLAEAIGKRDWPKKRKSRATVAVRQDVVRKAMHRVPTHTFTNSEVRALAKDLKCAIRTIRRDIKAARDGQQALPRNKRAHIHLAAGGGTDGQEALALPDGAELPDDERRAIVENKRAELADDIKLAEKRGDTAKVARLRQHLNKIDKYLVTVKQH